MKINTKRVLRTFLQSFFGSLAINIGNIFVIDTSTREQITVAILSVVGTAVTTGIAAIMNVESGDGNGEI